MEKGPLVVYIGDYNTQLCGDFDKPKDPYETTTISWKLRPGFFVAQLGIRIFCELLADVYVCLDLVVVFLPWDNQPTPP